MSKPSDTYFSAHFNRDGVLIGVDPPSGTEDYKKNQTKEAVTFKDIDDVRSLSIICKPGHSPCCIKMGPILYCWC